MTDLRQELIDNLPEPEENYSENGFEGDPYLSNTLETYFADKPERNFKMVKYDEIYNGREAWPPFTEILLFEVDNQLYAVDGQSDSWEGGWPFFDAETVRPVEKVEETITVTSYKRVDV